MKDNGGRTIKLDQAKFIDMGSQSRGSAFNVMAHGFRKSSRSLFGWLAETQTKRWLRVSAGNARAALV